MHLIAGEFARGSERIAHGPDGTASSRAAGAGEQRVARDHSVRGGRLGTCGGGDGDGDGVTLGIDGRSADEIAEIDGRSADEIDEIDGRSADE